MKLRAYVNKDVSVKGRLTDMLKSYVTEAYQADPELEEKDLQKQKRDSVRREIKRKQELKRKAEAQKEGSKKKRDDDDDEEEEPNEYHKLLHRFFRVFETARSIDKKEDILGKVYDKSGLKENKPSFVSHPHIWWVNGLHFVPFWNIVGNRDLEKIAALFESTSTIEIIQQEYKNALSHSQLWKENAVPSGKWRLFQLYDQGCKVTERCEICPRTVELLESVDEFMAGCVFGNAMISVLEPGSEIEAHTGPCNFRLRCHLTVFENKSFQIQVGTEVRGWEEGKMMVIDDSFVHRVWQEQSEEGEAGEDRVVLIFDIWHPDVNPLEREALKHLFKNPPQ